jgi:putative NADPH-quinone reductase
MPAVLKAFLEQVLRPGFAFEYQRKGMPKKLLKGKSARIVITMGMPASVYRWIYFAHSLRSLKRNILAFCGVGPIRSTLIGNVEGMTDEQRMEWLDEIRGLGMLAK